MDIRERTEVISEISRLLSGLREDERRQILVNIESLQEDIPISAFRSPISGLEVIVKFLKENARRTTKEIAKILNRKLTTIYTTYSATKIKHPEPLDLTGRGILIPTQIFQNRRYSILESLVAFLKENKRFSLHEIAALLNKQYNTVKTVYRRYMIKRRGRAKSERKK
ncbi:hypothetical protein GOV09_01630 [Candidatus Woesearchaeota archaeon]|nr:hypothetical protein [Candidatus Woesearchaeota archaeon]